MKLRFLVWLLIVLATLVGLARQWPVLAAEDCDAITCNKETQGEDEFLACNKRKQGCWETRISEAQSSANTLANTIAVLNGRIAVQELQIQQTESEISILERQIKELADRVAGLDLSLDRLSQLLVKRVEEHYKTGRLNPAFYLLATDSLNEAITNIKYLRLAQAQTAEAMERAESQRLTYDEQKALKETKQVEVEAKRRSLEGQQTTLTKERANQQFLLTSTRNDEARYQRELEKTLSELQAIQSIIAGRGDETEVRDVKQGDTIASIISGASACSTGTHLHFEVVKSGAHQNPAGYLRSIDASWDNQPDGAFGFGGDWEWPVNNPARITQGYGMTFYASVRRAYGGAPHTGIDMVSKDSGNNGVKAVRDGKLHRGSIPCGGSQLRYVRVEHGDELSTYYLHVNY